MGARTRGCWAMLVARVQRVSRLSRVSDDVAGALLQFSNLKSYCSDGLRLGFRCQ